MSRKRPSGRDCALAQSALAKLKASERRERELVASASPVLAPVIAMWRSGQGIRLIDLERRARFARLAC